MHSYRRICWIHETKMYKNQGLRLCAKETHSSLQKLMKKFLIQLGFFSVKMINSV